MTSNEELIAALEKLREYGASEMRYPIEQWDEPVNLVEGLVNALTDAITALATAQADLAARDAVIASIASTVDSRKALDGNAAVGEVRALLAQSPADALAAVKAKAWAEGVEAVEAAPPAFDFTVDVLARNPYRTTPTEEPAYEPRYEMFPGTMDALNKLTIRPEREN